MSIATRVLTAEQSRSHFKNSPEVGTSTREEIRINALSFLDELMKPVRSPNGYTIPFKPVPGTPALRDRLLWQENQPWQIFILPSGRPDHFQALELRGDVVIGSDARSEADIDVNLVQTNGFEAGVSRRHFLLRPTRDKLFVIDLNSTNGTNINGIPSPVGEAHQLRDGDLLTLGRLHLQVKIARQPGDTRQQS
jgi:FHA domain